MRRIISNEQIEEINRIYLECQSYEETAKRTKQSIKVVRRYIYPDFGKIPEPTIKRFDPNVTDCNFDRAPTEMFKDINNFGYLCVLSEEEEQEIRELWEEIV